MPPVSCPDIDSSHALPIILYNPNMTRIHWLFFALLLIAGLAGGLYYGWVVSPVQYVDTTPISLRDDFRADYTLMVAEAYQRNQNMADAARQLAYLGGNTPVEIVNAAIEFGQRNQYSPADISALQDLKAALQGWQPGAQPAQPATFTPQAPPAQP